MNDALRVANLDACYQLFEYLSALNFAETFFFFDILYQLSAIRIFHNQQQFISDDETLIELNDVFMIQCLQRVSLFVYFGNGSRRVH